MADTDSGWRKNKKTGGWFNIYERYVGGKHIIQKGKQKLSDAMKESGKFSKNDPEKEKNNYIDEIKDDRIRNNLKKSPVLENMTLEDVKMYENIQNGKIYSYDELKNSNIILTAEKYNEKTGIWFNDATDTPSKEQMLKFNNAGDEFISNINFEEIGNDKKAIIVTGLPSSGKSTAVVNELRSQYKMVEMDNDIVKTLFKKEYNNGKGANYVQGASSYTADNIILPKLTDKGTNVIIPSVGKSTSSLEKKIDFLKSKGYDVKIANVEIDKDKALNRAVARYVEKGRYVSINYIGGIDENKIKENYNTIKNSGKVSGWQTVDNNVPYGTKAEVKEKGGKW